MGTASESGEGSHELPAGDDVPKRLSEATWWPLVAAIGAGVLYTGAGLYLLGRGSVALIPRFVGPVVFLAGLATTSVGAFGWLYHAFVDEYWERDASALHPDAHRLGMVLFIVSDLATFAAGFVYYVFIRLDTWPPEHLPDLVSSLLVANTLVLIASSFTLELSHRALKQDRRQKFLVYLGVTVVLGAGFVAGQGKEYFEFIAKEGFTISQGIFGSAFFGLTGLHGLHVAFGTLLLAIVLVRALLGQYSGERDSSIETVSMYWHTVDAIWLVIVTLVYVASSLTPV